MKILFIGDIVGDIGLTVLEDNIASIKSEYNIDFVIANGENAANGKGINVSAANTLYNMGVDVITLGNHAFNNKGVNTLFDDNMPIIRPYNMPSADNGKGYIVIDCFKYKIAVINLSGQVYMDGYNSPFECIDNILDELDDDINIIFIDMHGEATSEKYAIGNYVDGRASVVVGTHTHVQTADERILNNGTAYISDVGMTGPYDSILGVKTDVIIKRFTSSSPVRFDIAEGDGIINAVVIEIDENTGKAVNIERINKRVKEKE